MWLLIFETQLEIPVAIFGFPSIYMPIEFKCLLVSLNFRQLRLREWKRLELILWNSGYIFNSLLHSCSWCRHTALLPTNCGPPGFHPFAGPANPDLITQTKQTISLSLLRFSFTWLANLAPRVLEWWRGDFGNENDRLPHVLSASGSIAW